MMNISFEHNIIETIVIIFVKFYAQSLGNVVSNIGDAVP